VVVLASSILLLAARWHGRPGATGQGDIVITYASLGTYVTEHELAVAGPLRETCVVGPRDTDDASAWRTEIGWPIFLTTAPTDQELPSCER
jgi:hypothetical protein